jgi:hypothetical protein
MAVRAVLAAGFVLLLAALGVTLSHAESRQAGGNQVPEVGEVVKRRGTWRKCQGPEIVPKDAAKLRLLVGTYGRPTPELRVTARARGRGIVTSGVLPAGGREGHVDIPVRRVGEAQVGDRVCVSVRGRSRARTVLYGAAGRLRLDWFREGSESWFELLPTIAHRFGLAKANPVGPFLLPLAALILLVGWVATARLVLRELGR